MTAQTYLVKDGVGNTITLNADGAPSGLTPRHGIESNGAAVTTANPLQVGGTLTLAFPTVAAGVVLSTGSALQAAVLGSGLTLSSGTLSATGGGGGGSVTSVTAGGLLSGGVITSSGTISFAAPAAGVVYSTGGSLQPLSIGANLTLTSGTLSATGSAGGTVTSVATGTGLSGGPITGAGTITLAQATTSTLGGMIVGSGLAISAGTLSASGTAGVTSIGGTSGVISLGSGLAIASGTLNTAGTTIDAQTGTTYTVLSADGGELLTLNNAAGVAVTLPSGSTTGFTATWGSSILNAGTAGNATITTTSLINNATGTVTLLPGDLFAPVSDGTNYLGPIVRTHLISMKGDGLSGLIMSNSGVVTSVTLGTNLSFTGTTLNATGGGGGVSAVVAGTGLNVGAGPGGTISTTGTLNITPATTAALGGVIAGSGIGINAGGTISATGTAGVASIGGVSGAITLSGASMVGSVLTVSGGGGGGTVLLPSSTYPNDSAGRLFPNFYSGAGGNVAAIEEGLGVKASLDADATWILRFLMPPTTPTGTLKLRVLSLANATSGAAKFTVHDATVAAGASPSAATLNNEAQSTVTWAAGDADKYKETKVTLTSTWSANGILVVGLTFNTTGFTLAAVSTHIVSAIWE